MGVVNTQYTFAANDVITSTKMNDIIDQTTVTDDAILGNTLEVAGGKLKIRAQGITSNELAANAVTNTQITNGSVTAAKLATGGPSWDGAGNLNVSNGLYVAGGTALNGSAGINGNLGVAGYVDCAAVYFGDDAGLLYDSGVGSVTVRYGVTGSEKFSTFGDNGSLIVGGDIASSSGNIRTYNFAGISNQGVVYFGDGDNFVYHNGSNFQFKFGASITATLSSSGTIWTSGNDGAGSGLDADLLDGLQPSAANAVDTIVRRDGNGDSEFRNITCSNIGATYGGFTGLGVTNMISGTTSGNVKQGGGNNQLGNTIYMGWRSDSTLGVQVDSTSFENNWPINVTGSSSYSTTSGAASVANSVINGSISASKLSGAQFGDAPVYGARAFGAIALTPTSRTMYNSGGNIASVTRIDSTHTLVNFAVNMPYTNYVVSGCVLNDANLEFATFEHNVDNFKIRHSSDTAGRNIQFVVFA